MHIVWKSLKKSHFTICILATKIAVLQLLFFQYISWDIFADFQTPRY